MQLSRRLRIGLVAGGLGVLAILAAFTALNRNSRKAARYRDELSQLQASYTEREMKFADLARKEPAAASLDRPQPGSFSVAQLKLIRTGFLTLEVPSFESASKELARLAQATGGYVADTESRRTPTGRISGKVVLRIPSAAFESTGHSIRGLGKVLMDRSNIEDVTKAYADLEIRLRVKREAEARVRELLRTRTGKLSEVLEAERELTRIIEEIERMEGERRFYDHQIQLSTLTVDLQEPDSLVALRPSSWRSLGSAFQESGSILSDSLAVMVRIFLALLPWAALGTGSWLAIRAWRRRRKAAQPPPETREEAEPKA
jgi:hypothetical protein